MKPFLSVDGIAGIVMKEPRFPAKLRFCSQVTAGLSGAAELPLGGRLLLSRLRAGLEEASTWSGDAKGGCSWEEVRGWNGVASKPVGRQGLGGGKVPDRRDSGVGWKWSEEGRLTVWKFLTTGAEAGAKGSSRRKECRGCHAPSE